MKKIIMLFVCLLLVDGSVSPRSRTKKKDEKEISEGLKDIKKEYKEGVKKRTQKMIGTTDVLDKADYRRQKAELKVKRRKDEEKLFKEKSAMGRASRASTKVTRARTDRDVAKADVLSGIKSAKEKRAEEKQAINALAITKKNPKITDITSTAQMRKNEAITDFNIKKSEIEEQYKDKDQYFKDSEISKLTEKHNKKLKEIDDNVLFAIRSVQRKNREKYLTKLKASLAGSVALTGLLTAGGLGAGAVVSEVVDIDEEDVPVGDEAEEASEELTEVTE